jgi:hypothetical protein
MKEEVKALKQKMKKDLRRERESHRREMRNMKVRFPSHTTNV